ncbi:MAG: membrane protein insertion efficiency factor YidD [Oscillospiraceae bacterium]|nr:membrane protein insertion efficiency factor YidD [Oscillospiraceae bacterium]
MKWLFLKLIAFYKKSISPYRPPCCRYYPTCSAYAEEAIRLYGARKGGWLALKRLLRCHPFSKRDKFDPVPRLADVKDKPKSKEDYK